MLALGVLVIMSGHFADAESIPADLVLRGGTIFVGKGMPRAAAIAVAGDRVLAVGSETAIAVMQGPKTRVVDLRGRLVVPGFNDAHVHLLSGGFGLLSVDLRHARDEADFARRIGEHARTLPKGTWIQAGNWDHEAWPSQALPTRQLIDPVTPDHPVFVNRLDGHMCSRELARLEVGRHRPRHEGRPRRHDRARRGRRAHRHPQGQRAGPRESRHPRADPGDEPSGGAGGAARGGPRRGDDDPGQLRDGRAAHLPGASKPGRAHGADQRVALRSPPCPP